MRRIWFVFFKLICPFFFLVNSLWRIHDVLLATRDSEPSIKDPTVYMKWFEANAVWPLSHSRTYDLVCLRFTSRRNVLSSDFATAWTLTVTASLEVVMNGWWRIEGVSISFPSKLSFLCCFCWVCCASWCAAPTVHGTTCISWKCSVYFWGLTSHELVKYKYIGAFNFATSC